MYRRYYDGYTRAQDNRPKGEIIVPHDIAESSQCDDKETAVAVTNNTALTACGTKSSVLPFSLEIDDIILIGILLFLLFDRDDNKDDDGNDIFILLIIGLILFADIF